MGSATQAARQQARKPYRCSICDEPIAVGQTYERWRWYDGGDATTIRVHPDCYALLQEHHDEEWTTGETWQYVLDELSDAEIEEAARVCEDPACAAALRAVVAEREVLRG